MSSVCIEVRDTKVVRVQSGGSSFALRGHVTHVLLVSILVYVPLVTKMTT